MPVDLDAIRSQAFDWLRVRQMGRAVIRDACRETVAPNFRPVKLNRWSVLRLRFKSWLRRLLGLRRPRPRPTLQVCKCKRCGGGYFTDPAAFAKLQERLCQPCWLAEFLGVKRKRKRRTKPRMRRVRGWALNGVELG
jgi:hypothetical protein